MDLLTELGAKHVRMVNLIAAPEGIRHVRLHYPKLPIFTAAVDKKLNNKGYILPASATQVTDCLGCRRLVK